MIRSWSFEKNNLGGQIFTEIKKTASLEFWEKKRKFRNLAKTSKYRFCSLVNLTCATSLKQNAFRIFIFKNKFLSKIFCVFCTLTFRRYWQYNYGFSPNYPQMLSHRACFTFLPFWTFSRNFRLFWVFGKSATKKIGLNIFSSWNIATLRYSNVQKNF